MAEILTLDQMLEESLLDIGLPIGERSLHPMQERQLKNMFYAAIGNFTVMVKNISEKYEPAAQEAILLNIDEELKAFWQPKTEG